MMKSPQSILRYVLALVGVFGLGFVLLVGLHFSFMELLDRFEQELENERSRIAIGETIIANINQIERNYYQLATTSAGNRVVEKIYTDSEIFFAHIEQAFAVYKNGGSLTVTTRLNEEGGVDFTRTIVYFPKDAGKNVFEILDLRPKIEEIKERMQTLASLIVQRNSLVSSGDNKALMAVREEIFIFFKKSSAHFVRLHEDANSLNFHGHKKLERLKAEISSRKATYTKISQGVMVGIISGILVICWIIARRIYAVHSRLDFVSHEMKKAKNQADTANKIKRDFLATMSHEVRTPINIIVGMTGLALKTTLTPTQHRYLSRIESAGEILLGLMNDILDFSKIEEGKLEFAAQPFDLKELIYAVVECVKVKARQKGIGVEAHVNEGPWVSGGDPVRLRQILLILVNNAIKFTEKGQVVIQAHLEELGADHLLVVVSVQDTGVGIAKEHLVTIFNTFAQGDASSTRKYGGTGLGLAISSQFAKLMGGEITVESEVAQGSIFTLSLPMNKVSSLGGHPTSGFTQILGHGSVGKFEILVVDSHGDQFEMAKGVLEAAGHRVKSAADGLDALRCMAKFQYDVVFLPLDMADLSGQEVAVDIRAFEKGEAVERQELGYDIDWLAARLNGQHTFLVAVSDYPAEKDQDFLQGNLFDDHIRRPFVENDLLDLMKRLSGNDSCYVKPEPTH